MRGCLRRVRIGGLLACGLLAGCKLIDQNTFAPAPEATPVAAAPAASTAALVPYDARRPLVSIDYAITHPNYRELLNYAVRAAEARDPNVQFDVVAELPDLSAVEQGQQDAGEVMRAIMADGVRPDRIHLGLHEQPNLAARQVRVYVR